MWWTPRWWAARSGRSPAICPERRGIGRPRWRAPSPSRTLRSTPSPPVITFNRPYATGRELAYIQEAIDNLHLSGNGPFAARCTEWLEARVGSGRAFLTSSCTSALEMAGMLAGLEPGDEVVMPSFTFVTSASSVVLRGAVPVFVDVRPDTLNIDEAAVEAAVGPKTKAIMPV